MDFGILESLEVWPTARGLMKSYDSQSETNRTVQRLIFFAAKHEEALYNQQKQDQELTVAQIMNSLLPNSDLN